MFSYGGSRSLPPVNKQTENVKLSFNGSYANRESGMEQARRIPRPLTNRSPTKWVRFVDEDWGRGYGALTALTQTVKAEWSKPSLRMTKGHGQSSIGMEPRRLNRQPKAAVTLI